MIEAFLIGGAVLALLFARTARAIERAGTVARDARTELESERARLAAANEDLRAVVRKLNRARREASELATAVEHVHVPIAILDGAWNVEFVNPAFERATGFARDFVLGRPIEVLSGLGDDDAARDTIETHLAQLGTWRGRLRNRRRDGSAYDTEATVTRVPGADPPRYVAVFRDSTPHRARPPVQHDAARRSNAPREPRPIAPVAREAVKRVRATLPSTVRISEQIAEDAGAVLAEPGEVHGIIADLAASAHHAMRRTGGVLTIAVEAITAERAAEDLQPANASRYARITVGDTGVGMDQAMLARAFDPPASMRDEGARGGVPELARVHGTVTALGGAVTVRSWPGAGTIVRVDLPCEDIAAAGESGRAADVA